MTQAVYQLTDAATMTPDFTVAGTGNGGKRAVFAVTLGGNRTLAAPVGARDGQFMLLRVTQDAAGGRTLTFGPGFTFGTSHSRPAPALTGGLATAGTTAEMLFVYASDPGEWRLIYDPYQIPASTALVMPDWS